MPNFCFGIPDGGDLTRFLYEKRNKFIGLPPWARSPVPEEEEVGVLPLEGPPVGVNPLTSSASAKRPTKRKVVGKLWEVEIRVTVHLEGETGRGRVSCCVLLLVLVML